MFLKLLYYFYVLLYSKHWYVYFFFYLLDVYEQLKFNLYQDDAVTGEAAGVAMGLVMLGSKSATAIEDMVAVCILIIYQYYFSIM